MSDETGHYHDSDSGEFVSAAQAAEDPHGTEFVTEGRHSGVTDLIRHLTPNPRLEGQQAAIAAIFHGVAVQMASSLPDSAELTAGLRKLLEAKDCFVRASL